MKELASNGNLIWVIPLLGSIGAVGAAIAAWRAAKQTKNSMLAQILMAVTDSYSSEDMLEGMMILRKWKDDCGNDFAVQFGNKRKDDYANVERVDKARRRYSHFFNKIKMLDDSKIIGNRFIKRICTADQVLFLLEVVEPLEKEIEVEGNKTYDKTIFDFFRELFKKELKM